MSISHTTKIQDPTSPDDHAVSCIFFCACCKHMASALSCDASSSPTWLGGHACSHNATKWMPGFVNGKKIWSSQNRVAGSEVGCQSSSFRLWTDYGLTFRLWKKEQERTRREQNLTQGKNLDTTIQTVINHVILLIYKT